MIETRPIKIGFSRPKSYFAPFAWLIMLVERRNYSHVYVRWYSSKADTDIVYHASGTFVHFLAFKYFEKKAHIVEEYEYNLPKTDYADLLHFCMSNAGADYGQAGTIGIGWVKLMQAAGRDVENPLNSESQWCSKLAALVLRDVINLKEAKRIKAGTAGPSAINKFIKRLPDKFKRVI